MCGASAVTSISERSSSSAMRSRSGSMPRAQCASKLRHAVGQQAHALQEVVGDQRLEDVELEVAGGAADADGDVVAHHLAAEHRQRLALGRVHLAGHDRTAGFVFGMLISPSPSAAPRPASGRRWRSSSARRPASSARRARRQAVVCGQRGELVGALTNGSPLLRRVRPPRARRIPGACSGRCRPRCRRSPADRATAARLVISDSACSSCAT
jgi:hypothetical protein